MGLKFKDKTSAGKPVGGDIAEREIVFNLKDKEIYSSTDGNDVVLLGNTDAGYAVTTANKNVLINASFKINQRGFDGNWDPLNVGDYGWDRWRKDSLGNITQVVEEGFYIGDEDYVLSADGVLISQVTSPASGNWTVTVPETSKNIQLELGTVVTSFEKVMPQDDMVRCKRYYQTQEYVDMPVSCPHADGADADERRISYFRTVPMRIDPTEWVEDTDDIQEVKSYSIFGDKDTMRFYAEVPTSEESRTIRFRGYHADAEL